MTPTRKLGLKTERLTELTTDELLRVAAAAPDAVPGTLNVRECLSLANNTCATYRCTTNIKCTGD